MNLLRRIFCRESRSSALPVANCSTWNAADQRIAALEREVVELRRVHDAVLYALGAQPSLHHDRLRRDLLVALAAGRDAVPLKVLEPLDQGIESWRARGSAA